VNRPHPLTPRTESGGDDPVPSPAARALPPGEAARPVPRFLYWLLGGVTIFFLVVTLFQLQSLQARVDSPPRIDLASALAPLDEGAVSTGDRLLVAQWRTLALLEQNAQERRYHQANLLVMSRTWIRYLGFMTGMIMALVGAAFVLGKLREESSALAIKNAVAEANITTTSPGLVLCTIGMVLMLATLLTHNDIETWEADPLYTRVLLTPDGSPVGPPLPLPVDGMTDPLGADTVPDPLAEP
jgi:hypothetical protein